MAYESSLSLMSILDRWVEEKPDQEALCFVPDSKSGDIAERLTYEQLTQRARDIGAWLLEQGYRPGQRAMLLFPAGLDFVTAFFACAHAGLIAVPAPLPERTSVSIERLDSVLADAEPVVVLTDDASLPGLRKWLADHGRQQLDCVSVEGKRARAGAAATSPDRPAVGGDDVALLQYTSGSTSAPKGVMITHGNLLANLERIDLRMGRIPNVRLCGWLPLTHDMGLIGQLLHPLRTGGTCILLPPTEFLKRPHRWLALIDRYDATCAVGPNFAYDMCARVADDAFVEELDLSRCVIAFNGAEPIDPATLTRFSERFAPAGFRAEAFMPCYGLAEATLLVSGKRHGTQPVTTDVDADLLSTHVFQPASAGGRARRLVSSGTLLDDSVVIVDPRTHRPLADGAVGEIWVAGPCVGQGYWNRSEESDTTFRAALHDGSGHYLRTGDLGVRYDGELYVTGRIKDLIIVNGRNLYPHDLERLVREQAGELTFGQTAVFALDGDQDVVVVQELRHGKPDELDLTGTARTIKHELAQQFGVGRASVVFVRPGAVRRTTSGKVRRSAMRDLFRAGALGPVHESLADGLRERMEKERI